MQMEDLAVAVVSVEPSVTLRLATRLMHDESVGSLAVMRHGALVGIFTERDLVEALAAGSDPDEVLVEEWMTHDPDKVDADVPVEDAAAWMLGAGYRHLPVTDDGRVVGMVSIKDVLWAVLEPLLAEDR